MADYNRQEDAGYKFTGDVDLSGAASVTLKDNSVPLAKIARGTNGQLPIGQTGAALAYKAMSGDATIDQNGAITVGAGAITAAKMKVFLSTEQTGNGSAQNIAHGLGVTPAIVVAIPTDLTPATIGSYAAVAGAHDGTNCIFTVTTGKKYKVLAIG